MFNQNAFHKIWLVKTDRHPRTPPYYWWMVVSGRFWSPLLGSITTCWWYSEYLNSHLTLLAYSLAEVSHLSSQHKLLFYNPSSLPLCMLEETTAIWTVAQAEAQMIFSDSALLPFSLFWSLLWRAHSSQSLRDVPQWLKSQRFSSSMLHYVWKEYMFMVFLS